ncbi:hypothetical protein F4679DRAFT_535851 [Xylaria curta]|nr:hypothetical protein F4679DRAFT_535851 [Xylaria curta]
MLLNRVSRLASCAMLHLVFTDSHVSSITFAPPTSLTGHFPTALYKRCTNDESFVSHDAYMFYLVNPISNLALRREPGPSSRKGGVNLQGLNEPSLWGERRKRKLQYSIMSYDSHDISCSLCPTGCIIF